MRIYAGASPVLQVADVARSLAWYADVLGFEVDPFPKEPPHAFAILTRDRAELMLQRRADGPGPTAPGTGLAVYLRLRGGDLLALADEARARTPILRGPERMPYGDVEFEVADPDGHRICVSEVLPDDAPVPVVRED